jgi:hypothetical protein
MGGFAMNNRYNLDAVLRELKKQAELQAKQLYGKPTLIERMQVYNQMLEQSKRDDAEFREHLEKRHRINKILLPIVAGLFLLTFVLIIFLFIMI